MKYFNVHNLFWQNPEFSAILNEQNDRSRSYEIMSRANLKIAIAILLIVVSVVRRDQYLSIGTKTKFIGDLVAKIQGGRLQPGLQHWARVKYTIKKKKKKKYCTIIIKH